MDSSTPTRDSTRMQDIERALTEVQQAKSTDSEGRRCEDEECPPHPLAGNEKTVNAPPATPSTSIPAHESFPGTPSLLANTLDEHSAPIAGSTPALSPFRFGGSWTNEGQGDPFAPHEALETHPETNIRAPTDDTQAMPAERTQMHAGWCAEDVRTGKRRRMSSPPTFTPSPTHLIEQTTQTAAGGRDLREGGTDAGNLAPPQYSRMTTLPPAIEQNVSHIRTQGGWTHRDEERERTLRIAGQGMERQDLNARGLVTMPRRLAGELLNTMIPGAGDITLPANVFEALIQQARESALMSGPFQGAVYAQQPQQPALSRTNRTLATGDEMLAWNPHPDTSPDNSMDVDASSPILAHPEHETQSAMTLDDRMTQIYGPGGYGRPGNYGAAYETRATPLRLLPTTIPQTRGQPTTFMAPQMPMALTYPQPTPTPQRPGILATPRPHTAQRMTMAGAPSTVTPSMTLSNALPPPPLRRDARLTLSERARTATGNGGGTHSMATRTPAIPRMPTYVDRLVGLGRANCMMTPENGFPTPQGRGFGDATRYDSDARKAIWMGIPENQRCVIDVVAKHTFTVQEATRMTTDLRKAIALVTGETAPFFVLPPETITSREQWVDGPPGWLPVGLSERSVGILVEHKVFAFREFAFTVLDGANPQLPEHLFSLEGVTQDVDYVYVEVVQTCLWTQAAEQIRNVVEGQPQYSSDPDLYAKHLLETITAEIEKLDEDAIVVHISMMPPTKDEAKWLDWRKEVQKCVPGDEPLPQKLPTPEDRWVDRAVEGDDRSELPGRGSKGDDDEREWDPGWRWSDRKCRGWWTNGRRMERDANARGGAEQHELWRRAWRIRWIQHNDGAWDCKGRCEHAPP
ncbi:hypothetical protein C2E23DRAFT_883495 [Lenzites betulinus]|nr:hypothetical protein C2E23DRAFT_883495 [Lenzites betulinus]